MQSYGEDDIFQVSWLGERGHRTCVEKVILKAKTLSLASTRGTFISSRKNYSVVKASVSTQKEALCETKMLSLPVRISQAFLCCHYNPE
jgi:hypothetical protein